MILHGGLVALLDRGRWRGVLILGPSGAGKSDLALRLLDAGFALVADDRVIVWTSGGRVWGRAPDSLSGLMEIHGYGIVAAPTRAFSAIDLVVDVDPEAPVERMPDPAVHSVLGMAVPLVRQRAHEVSAAAKIRRWLMGLG